MESSELKTIIEKSGLSAYRIEKDLKIPNGTLNQVIKGTKKLPEKYEEPLRGLVALDLDKVEKIATGEQGTISDAIVPAKLTIEEVPEPEEGIYTKEGDTITLSKQFEPFAETEEVLEVNLEAIPELSKEEIMNEIYKAPISFQKKQVKRPDMSIADLL